MKKVGLAIGFFLAIAILVCGIRAISTSSSTQRLKIDYAEVNHIKYGLFSIDAWKDKLEVIVFREINHLTITSANKKELQKHVEKQLDGLIDQVTAKIRKTNEGSAKGRIKQAFIDAVVDIKDIKKGIPEYAQAIIERLSKPQTKMKMKQVLKKKVDRLFGQTFDEQDKSQLEAIEDRMATSDLETAKQRINQQIAGKAHELKVNELAVIGLAILLFVFTILTSRNKQLSSLQFFPLVAALLTLLAAGISIPMIDLEAKVSQMSFVLMGEPVRFDNQILYFQSKSILDVFHVMFSSHDVKMKIVGVLMVTFSIVFPLLKILSSMIYRFNFAGLRKSKVIDFLVFKTGKWSMADVWIVAIFMAYIGFNGMMSSQLGELNSAPDSDVVILTTNGTTLQPGFYLFLSFAILAIVFAQLLKKTEVVERADF